MVPDAPLSPIGPRFRLLFVVDRYEELACKNVGSSVVGDVCRSIYIPVASVVIFLSLNNV